jgi:N-methylhydantoinase B/oxoprolinase/acetone carboxylase alpha subunit
VWDRLNAGASARGRRLRGEVEHLPSKASGVLTAGDVHVFFAPGGGEFGDPLDREPNALRATLPIAG